MSKKLNVIVLCGGFGTRIKSSIGNLPKILAPINGIPFINYFLKWLDPILSIKDVQLTFSAFYNFKPILNYLEKYHYYLIQMHLALNLLQLPLIMGCIQ